MRQCFCTVCTNWIVIVTLPSRYCISQMRSGFPTFTPAFVLLTKPQRSPFMPNVVMKGEFVSRCQMPTCEVSRRKTRNLRQLPAKLNELPPETRADIMTRLRKLVCRAVFC